MKSSRKTRFKRKKPKRRKTYKGGFLSELGYFMQQAQSFILVRPPAPLGNPTLPTKPFAYSQNNLN